MFLLLYLVFNINITNILLFLIILFLLLLFYKSIVNIFYFFNILLL